MLRDWFSGDSCKFITGHSIKMFKSLKNEHRMFITLCYFYNRYNSRICPKIVAKMIFLPNKSIHSYIPFPNLRFIKTRFILSSKLILQIVSFLFDMLIIGYFSIGDGG